MHMQVQLPMQLRAHIYTGLGAMTLFLETRYF